MSMKCNRTDIDKQSSCNNLTAIALLLCDGSTFHQIFSDSGGRSFLDLSPFPLFVLGAISTLKACPACVYDERNGAGKRENGQRPSTSPNDSFKMRPFREKQWNIGH